ncbi:cytochrome P450 monooxygenase [Colletotrichum tofieldiae]|nr:cytochrome P450 monooxygenase [Colletotrichum tofieldiae]
MDNFKPKRWPVQHEQGNEGYSTTAGLTLPFGLGLQGWFGRKLAYTKLKLMTTPLVWAFEFQQCPQNLSSYDCVKALTRNPLECFVRFKIRYLMTA